MSPHILLTGGNGFIGSHILAQLLDQGFNICCAVRTQSKADKILKDFSNQRTQISTTIVPDITIPGAYDIVITGNPPYDAVIHTASPYSFNLAESNIRVLDAAVKGTLNLLKAVNQHAPSVKRVVYTGSCASIVDYSQLVSHPPKSYTEQDWNPITWEEALDGDKPKAYRASKKFAELEAWNFIRENKVHFDLVTICPSATFGPTRHSISGFRDLNESNIGVWKICFQSTKEGPVPYIPMHTYVDVRDLASAHVAAILVPEAGNQRFIVSAGQFSFQNLCDIIRSKFPKLQERTPLGKPGTNPLPEGAYNIDNTKVSNVLGLKFRDLQETAVDFARYILEIEAIEKRANATM